MKAFLTFFITSFCSYLASGNNFFIALKQKNTDILLDAFNNVSNPESSHYGHFWQQSEINDLVCKLALVMPKRTGSYSIIFLFWDFKLLLISLNSFI